MVLFALLVFVPLSFGIVIAQNNGTNSTNPSISILLLDCGNGLRQFWPDLNPQHHNASLGWNLIALLPSNDVPQYAVPQGGVPFQEYEGFNTSAYFFSTTGNHPRGWIFLNIPTSARGKKTLIQVGKLWYEGVEFNCARLYGGLYTGGPPSGCTGSFCAGYSYCHSRYECRRERWPDDKECIYPDQRNFCWPSWDPSRSPPY